VNTKRTKIYFALNEEKRRKNYRQKQKTNIGSTYYFSTLLTQFATLDLKN